MNRALLMLFVIYIQSQHRTVFAFAFIICRKRKLTAEVADFCFIQVFCKLQMESITCFVQIPDYLTTCIDCSDDGILKLPYFRVVSHPFPLLPLKIFCSCTNFKVKLGDAEIHLGISYHRETFLGKNFCLASDSWAFLRLKEE